MYCDCFLEYIHFEDNLLEYKLHRLHCDKNYQHKSDKKIKERLFKTYKFSKP